MGRLAPALLLTFLASAPAAAQQPGLSGYYLNVATHVEGSVLGPAGASDVQRLRLMWNASPGPVRLDAAYEQTLPYRLTDAWRETLGPDAEEKHLAWRYRLANLALVGGANDAPGEHRSFDAKKEWYRRSPVSLTKRVAEQPAWDEATLLRRSQELVERAVRVWPWEQGPMETE